MAQLDPSLRQARRFQPEPSPWDFHGVAGEHPVLPARLGHALDLRASAGQALAASNRATRRRRAASSSCGCSKTVTSVSGGRTPKGDRSRPGKRARLATLGSARLRAGGQYDTGRRGDEGPFDGAVDEPGRGRVFVLTGKRVAPYVHKCASRTSVLTSARGQNCLEVYPCGCISAGY